MKTIKWYQIILIIVLIVITAFPLSVNAATKGKTYIFSLNGNLQEDGKYKNMNDLILQIFFTNERYNNSVKSKYMLNQYNTSNSKSEKQVLDAIKKAFSGSNSSDLGVFLYNGHGFDTGKALALSSNNAVTYKNLAQTLASTGCGRFLVIINACHSGGFIDNGIKKLSYKDRQRFHVITSCKTSENSYKSETDGSSYYMECIVNALEYNTDGKWSGYIACDVNHDKKIDICEIYAYSKDYLRRKYGDKTQQTPQQYSLNSDEAIFAYKPLSIKLNYSSKDLYENETVQLTAMVSGNGSGVTWSSSNNAVATVSKGKVKAIKKGTAVITATVVLLGKKYSKTCTINVKSKNNTVNDASISLSKTSLTIQKGKSTTLKATVKGKFKTVTWKSSDKSIATVDKNGKVTGKKEGTATITATANGVSAKCKVTVAKQSSSKNGSVAMVSVGRYHTAIVKTDGTLWMWGINEYGELGDGTNENKSKPVIIMSNVKSVSAGACYTAIVKTDSTLWMCGDNNYGQLGDGARYIEKNKPEKIMSGVKSVSAGWCHTAILKTDGTLWMCGVNSFGQLGDGTNTDRDKPIKIMSDVKSVSVGDRHTAILKTDGTLWMCGNNEFGQLGDGTNTNKNKPVKIMSGVKSVSTKDKHTAILKTDGTLWMCGNNNHGALGDGTRTEKNKPFKILSDVKSVSAGECCTAIVKTDSTLWMCGLNFSGQLGDGTETDKYKPVKIMNDVNSVSARSGHTAILKNDGTLWMCGYGQQIDGTHTSKTKPVKIM